MPSSSETTDSERLQAFVRRMMESEDYLPYESLQHGWAYQLFARNAFAGVWDAVGDAFLIARYDVGDTPYLGREVHWDRFVDPPFRGTTKPLVPVARCPLELNEQLRSASHFDPAAWPLLRWLQALERKYPILPGIDTVRRRRDAAIKYEGYLRGRRVARAARHRTPVWKLLKEEKSMKVTKKLLEEIIGDALDDAKGSKKSKKQLGDSEGEINSRRSKEWVDALAQKFRDGPGKAENMRVFSKGCEDHRAIFKVNEYLYDITVIQTATIKSPTGKDLEYPKRTLWHVESEFASSDSRQSIVDFGKLLMSAAENKLMILPAGGKIEDWAGSLHQIVPPGNGNFYFAFVPHPGKWHASNEPPVKVERLRSL